MTPEIIQLIAQNGGVLGLAIFTIVMLNKSWADRLAEAQRYAAEVKQYADNVAEQRREVLAALNRNTEVMTKICERLDK